MIACPNCEHLADGTNWVAYICDGYVNVDYGDGVWDSMSLLSDDYDADPIGFVREHGQAFVDAYIALLAKDHGVALTLA